MLPRALARPSARIALGLALALGAAACSESGPPAAPAPRGPHVAWFEGGFEQALDQARVQNRLVLVDFWAEW